MGLYYREHTIDLGSDEGVVTTGGLVELTRPSSSGRVVDQETARAHPRYLTFAEMADLG